MRANDSNASLRRATNRALLYLVIGGAALVFAAPLIWLVVTALKPIEQSMSLPPTLLPRAYHAVIDGSRKEVVIDHRVPTAGVVAEVVVGEQSGRRIFVSGDEASRRAGELRVLHRVEAGWTRVSERLEEADTRVPAWDIVPSDAVEMTIQPRWRNFPTALSRLGGTDRVSFWRFLGNTLIVCVLGVVGTVLSNAIVAYGFARLRWRGRDAFFALTLATMMVPFPVLMVPLYGVFRSLGLIGTLVPLWLPAFFGSAFNIFLMRQFFRAIPEELSEAARIDGCSEWKIFWRIILPLSKPVLVTAGVFHFLHAWNDFLGPLLYLTRTEDYTLAIALQSFQSQAGGVQWHYLMAASTVVTLPVILLFFFAQKTFVQGIATTGSKS